MGATSPPPAADALRDALRQFRLLEARGVALTLATDYPIASGYADMLDDYHGYLISQVPGTGFSRRPFALTRGQLPWLADERRRLTDVWSQGAAAQHALALAYWSVAHYDAIRAAIWLREVHRDLPPTPADARAIDRLSTLIESACDRTGTARGGGLDLYAALQVAADSAAAATDTGQPFDTIRRYQPRPLWKQLTDGQEPTS